MKCPNCDNEMKDKSYNYYGIGDWDMDYPASYHEEYSCSKCRIKYINGTWIIPNNLKATDKQIKCVETINNILKTTFEPLIKSKTTKFISENRLKSMWESAKRKNVEQDEWEWWDYYDGLTEGDLFW